jgi:hypothetical protein
MARLPRSLVLLALLAATPVAAVDHPLVGTKLVIKVTPTVSKAAFVAKMPQPIPVPTPGGSDDPGVHGARFKLFEVHGEKAVFDLPAEGWTANASETVFKFVNREAPGGPTPVRVAVIKGTVVKVKSLDAGVLLPTGCLSAGVELQAGDGHWCSDFGNPSRSGPGLCVVRRQELPPDFCQDFWGSPSGAFLDAP